MVSTNVRWLLWGLVALTGIGAALGLVLTRGGDAKPLALAPASNGAAAVWAPGQAAAPGFSLTDQAGKPVSLAAYRGRPAIVTFIDPLCRDFCPLEAKVLNDALAALPPASRPPVIAVSTNVYGNARIHLLQDIRKWRVGPQWRWAVGTGAQLSPVWRNYHVSVLVRTKRVAGVTVHTVLHTEAAYVVDGDGNERALFIWPFTASAVERTLRSLG
jgi:protein SCO1